MNICREIENLLKEAKAEDSYNTPDEVKIEILKKVLPKCNLKIGQVINRHNEAGDSYNKVIGFILSWQKDENYYIVDETSVGIICDRVKRYNKSYSCYNNNLEFYHGEIWSMYELNLWRDKGYITENTPEAEAEFEKAVKEATKTHECRFTDRMLTW